MKYFGVGLPRTGTKSLAAAFTMFGLRTQHVVLDGYVRYDALCDTPIWANWRELDEQYPDSKWVLTVRDPEAWIESFEKNLLTDYKRWMEVGLNNMWNQRHNQDVKAYTKVFKGMEFDRLAFKTIFIEHEHLVTEHFASRPEDLLVLDVSAETAFVDFMNFLGKGYSDISFPRLSGGWDGPLNAGG